MEMEFHLGAMTTADRRLRYLQHQNVPHQFRTLESFCVLKNLSSGLVVQMDVVKVVAHFACADAERFEMFDGDLFWLVSCGQTRNGQEQNGGDKKRVSHDFLLKCSVLSGITFSTSSGNTSQL